MRARRSCPSCGAASVVPIVYGEPTPAATRAADLGLLMTRGCLVYDDLPRCACLACEHRWAGLTTPTRPPGTVLSGRQCDE